MKSFVQVLVATLLSAFLPAKSFLQSPSSSAHAAADLIPRASSLSTGHSDPQIQTVDHSSQAQTQSLVADSRLKNSADNSIHLAVQFAVQFKGTSARIKHIARLGPDTQPGPPLPRNAVEPKRAAAHNPFDFNGKFIGKYDPDCHFSLPLTPGNSVDLRVDENIIANGGTTCHWNVIGEENCVPVVKCRSFALAPPESHTDDDDKCIDEYLRVTDGFYGTQKFCGNTFPKALTSNKKIRDFYITLKLSSKGKVTRKFHCGVTCGNTNDTSQKATLLETSSDDSDTSDYCRCGLSDLPLGPQSRSPRTASEEPVNEPINVRERDSSPKKTYDKKRKRKSGPDAKIDNTNKNTTTVGEDDDDNFELEEDKSGVFPWTVALVARGSRKPFCTGAVINQWFLLTSAQCLKGKFSNVINFHALIKPMKLDMVEPNHDDGPNLTPKQLAKIDAKEGAYRFHVTNYFVHPLYNKLTYDYDAAVLKLERPINPEKHTGIKPVCLPPIGVWGEPLEGRGLVVSGWDISSNEGHTNSSSFRHTRVTTVKSETCNTTRSGLLTDRLLCVESGKKAEHCQGDLGGALVAEKTVNVWQHVGIQSLGDGCKKQKEKVTSSVFTDTREIVQWIRYVSTMDDDQGLWCL